MAANNTGVTISILFFFGRHVCSAVRQLTQRQYFQRWQIRRKTAESVSKANLERKNRNFNDKMFVARDDVDNCCFHNMRSRHGAPREQAHLR
jgi:hypothetical protein